MYKFLLTRFVTIRETKEKNEGRQDPSNLRKKILRVLRGARDQSVMNLYLFLPLSRLNIPPSLRFPSFRKTILPVVFHRHPETFQFFTLVGLIISSMDILLAEDEFQFRILPCKFSRNSRPVKVPLIFEILFSSLSRESNASLFRILQRSSPRHPSSYRNRQSGRTPLALRG